MVSEWERLESLSKEDIIIEFVKTMIEPDDPVNYERTTDEWARRIALHAFAAYDRDDGFAYEDICDYGLNEDQAERVFDELVSEGKFDYPTYDPRSKNFSGVPGKTKAQVERMDPAERERRIAEWKEASS